MILPTCEEVRVVKFVQTERIVDSGPVDSEETGCQSMVVEFQLGKMRESLGEYLHDIVSILKMTEFYVYLFLNYNLKNIFHK